jgi:Tfp pilus assembly protein PilF
MQKFIITILVSLCFITAAQASAAPVSNSEEAAKLMEQGNKAWSEQKMDQAEQSFRKALELDPDSSLSHAHLASLLQTMNRGPEAIEEYQTAITLDAENPQLYVALAVVYLHQQSYSMAQAMANEALRLDPELANAKKLLEYVDAKEEVLERAAKAEISGDASASDGLPANHPTSSPAH